MRKYIVPIVVGVAVAIGIFWGLTALFSATGDAPPASVWFAPIFLGIFTAYIMANLVGTRKTASAGAAERNAALSASPPDGKAALLIFREGFIGKAAGLDVSVDGKAVAQLKAPRFTRILVSPGDHEVQASFAGLAGAQNKPGAIGVTVAAGQTAAVRISLSMGALQNTIRMEGQDTATAKGKLARMTMTVPDLAEV